MIETFSIKKTRRLCPRHLKSAAAQGTSEDKRAFFTRAAPSTVLAGRRPAADPMAQWFKGRCFKMHKEVSFREQHLLLSKKKMEFRGKVCANI